MGAKKDKKKGKQQQEEAAPQETKEEAPEPEQTNPSAEDKPADKPEPAPQEPVVADEVQPKEAEDPKEDKVEVLAAKTNKSENNVGGLLVELLTASHDVARDEDKVVEGSKVFEAKVPKILSDLVNVSGFNEETVSELRTYLERAQKVNFLEKFEELSTRSTPKVKDVVVDETNFDVLIGKLADFQGTSLKKNLNEQWKRLEESESFKTYLATKPLPVPVEAPEVALLADSTAKCASLESALKSLQTLHKHTEATLAGLWEHKTDAVEGLLEARKQYLQDVQLLPEEIRAVVGEAEKLVQAGVGQELRVESRQEEPQVKLLKEQLENARKASEANEQEFNKTITEKDELYQKAHEALQAAEESLEQKTTNLAELENNLKEQTQKVAETEKSLKLANQDIENLKLEIQKKDTERDSLKQAASNTENLEEERDNLKQTNKDLLAEIDTFKNAEIASNTQLAEKTSELEKANNQLQELKSNLTNSEQKRTELAAALTTKEAEISNLQSTTAEVLESVRILKAALEHKTQELLQKSEEIGRLESELNQEKIRNSDLTASVLLQHNTRDELSDANVSANRSQVDGPVQNVDVVEPANDAQAHLEQSQDLSTPPNLEGDVADQSVKEPAQDQGNQVDRDAIDGVVRLQEQLQLKESALIASEAQVQAANSQLTNAQQQVEVLLSEKESLLKNVQQLESKLAEIKATESSVQESVDVESIKAAHAQDVKLLEDVRSKLIDVQEELERSNIEKANLEAQLSQQKETIRNLQHDNNHLKKESEKFKEGQDEQYRVVQEKDQRLEKIAEQLKNQLSIKVELEQEYQAADSAYKQLKVKYEDLKKKYSHKSSGASTPAKLLSGSDIRSSRQSVGPKIDEAGETEREVSEEAQQHLNQAADPNVDQSLSAAIVTPFDVDQSLLQTLFSLVQKLLNSTAISKPDGGNRSVPVTSEERITLDGLMLQISRHWQTQKAHAPQETAVVAEATEMVEEETPQTLSHVFDELNEQIEILKEQKQSLSISLETFLNLLKKLIPKVLGPSGLKPLEECCTVAQVTEEIAHILKGDFSTKLDEIIASASSVASLNAKIARYEKEIADLKTRNQQLQGPAERLSQVEKLLTTPRNNFREQNPVNILQQVAAATETSPVNVEVWRKGLATGVAHVIKDLLRRILSVVPQLHTVNPKRNAPWINHLLDVMSGVSSGTDALLSQLSSAEDSQSFEEFVKQLQKTVCTALEGHN